MLRSIAEMDFKAIGSSGDVRNDVRMNSGSFPVKAIASGLIAASACSGSHRATSRDIVRSQSHNRSCRKVKYCVFRG